MEALIKIEEQNGKQAVSARELHAFLESKQEFTHWFKDRIEKFDLVENQDYCLLDKIIMQKGRGGHNRLEYSLSIDAAKELSMVEGNEKGKQARRYFIETEKAYKNDMSKGMLGFQIPQTYSQALRALADSEEGNERLMIQNKEKEAIIKDQEPRVLFAKAVETSDTSILVADLAKILKQNGCDTGQNRMFEYMRSNGYLCTRGEHANHPSQRAMDMGLFEIKETSITKPNGTVLVSFTPKVTGKGQTYFVNKFLKKETV